MITYTKKVQSGRSMIEMLGVLAIVGILSAGGIAGYSMAMQSYKVSALTEKVNLIAQQARILYEGGQYDEADMDKELVRSGMLNADISGNAAGQQIANPFGGYLEVKSTGSTSSPATEFLVATNLGNIPSEACIKLLTTDWGTTGVFTSVAADSAKFANAAAVTTAAATKGGTSAAKTSPVPSETAVSYCSGGNKFMGWVFK